LPIAVIVPRLVDKIELQPIYTVTNTSQLYCDGNATIIGNKIEEKVFCYRNQRQAKII